MTTKYSTLTESDFVKQVETDFEEIKKDTPWYLKWLKSQLLDFLKDLIIELITRQNQKLL